MRAKLTRFALASAGGIPRRRVVAVGAPFVVAKANANRDIVGPRRSSRMRDAACRPATSN